jgi:hypothetical protein
MTDPRVEKLGRVLADMGKPSRMPLKRHRDDDYWDSVDIDAAGVSLRAKVIPRYKTSGMSGDEWRVHVELLVKDDDGRELLRKQFHRMRNMQEHAACFLWTGGARAYLERPRALMVVRRKNVVLMRQSFQSFGDAAMGIGWHIVCANEGSRDVEWHHLSDEEERARTPQKNSIALSK